MTLRPRGADRFVGADHIDGGANPVRRDCVDPFEDAFPVADRLGAEFAQLSVRVRVRAQSRDVLVEYLEPK